jgi:Fe-S cluster assembly protein SufD
MKTVLLTSQENITLNPDDNTQYVLIPTDNVDLEITMEERGVEVNLLVVYALHGKDKITLNTKSVHTVPNTSCNVEIKAALFDSSKSSYEGQILITKDAQQTKSFLRDDVLLFGNGVSNVCKPVLEISANDVKASHGATSGQINEEQLYYLMSRGLTKKEALNIILKGFFESLLTKIEDEKIREKVTSELFKEINVQI